MTHINTFAQYTVTTSKKYDKKIPSIQRDLFTLQLLLIALAAYRVDLNATPGRSTHLIQVIGER